MNAPVVPELTNDAVVDSHPEVVSQRARDLLCSIAAKREKLEQHQKSGITSNTKMTSMTIPSSAMTKKIQAALREKRSRLRKHLRVEESTPEDHQDNTQTTETSTATPGTSPYVIGHNPIKVQGRRAPTWTPLSPSQQTDVPATATDVSKVHNLSHSSKSFDETHSLESSSPLRKTRSFDADLLRHKLLAVSKRGPNSKEDRETARTEEGPTKTKLSSNARPNESRVQMTIKQSKNRLGRRTRSFDTSRKYIHRPQISLSMSLDRGLSCDILKSSRGDRTQHFMSFNDIEVPLEISPIDKRSLKEISTKATVSRRTGSKIAVTTTSSDDISKGCTLESKAERAAYIGELYRPSSKLHMLRVSSNPSDRRKEKANLDHQIIKSHQEENQKTQSAPIIAVGHNYDRPPSNGEDLMKLSLKNNGDRREMLRRLQLDLNRPKPTAKMMEAVRKAATIETSDDSSTEEYISFSDDSSCDFTTTSEITAIGSVSSAIEPKKRTIVTFADQLPRQRSGENYVNENPATIRLRSAPRKELSTPHIRKPPQEAALLFTSLEDDGDQRCCANGGLFDIAIKSGLDTLDDVPLKSLPRANFIRPQIRLSTDYRCGTYGSSYDIALRSGYLSEIATTPLRRHKTKGQRKTKTNGVKTVLADPRKPFARGSLYDLALQSGLTKEMIRTRSSFSFTVQHRSSRSRPCIVSPKDSDRRCGASGSVFLAASCIDRARKKAMPRKALHNGLYSIQEVDIE